MYGAYVAGSLEKEESIITSGVIDLYADCFRSKYSHVLETYVNVCKIITLH